MQRRDIPEIRFVSMPQYLEALSAYPSLAWVYRGQANAAWNLLPKAGRPGYFRAPLKSPEAEGLPPGDICRFNYWRQLAVAYQKDLPRNDFECLAVAQHHGLATRLLDWSTNPLAALFFAVDSCSPCDGAVYAYSQHRVIDSQVNQLGNVPQVALFMPQPYHPRILHQCGVFTYHPEPSEPLCVEVVQNLGPISPPHDLNLVRFLVEAKVKSILKRCLDDLGINRKSLFPDLDGLSDFVNSGTRRTASFGRA
jgi:hypothetical protein